MFVPGDSHWSRRHLPHLENYGKTYYVTFSTIGRRVLSPDLRQLALGTCLFEHERSSYIDCVVIMPDHVHMILTPYANWRLPRIVQRIKGVSAHDINKALGRSGAFWQDESFDRILREGDLDEKRAYVCGNPVAEGLVATPEDYPWLWRCWADAREGVEDRRPACPT
jgi:putative transposase